MYNYAYHRMTSLQYGEMDKGKETKKTIWLELQKSKRTKNFYGSLRIFRNEV